MSFSVEKFIRVYNDKEGVFIQVRPNSEISDDLLIVEVHDAVSRDWYGSANISISKEEAKLLAKILIEMSGE